MAQSETAKQRFFEALDCLDARNFAEAERLFHLTLEVIPDHLSSLNNLSIAQFEQAKFSDAVVSARKILEQDRQNLAALTMLSTCELRSGNHRDALTACQAIVTIDPRNAEAYYKIGFIKQNMGAFDEAIQALDAALEIQPRFAEALLHRGLSFQALADPVTALAAYDDAIAIAPEFAEAWWRRGNLALELGRHSDALSAYERYIEFAPDPIAGMLGRGYALSELSRFEEALDAFSRAIELNGDNAAAWLGQGNALRALGRSEEAAKAYERATLLQGGYLEAWIALGHAMNECRDFDKALHAFDTALSIEQASGAARRGRAFALARMGRHVDAEGDFRCALAAAPDDSDMWISLGNLLTTLTRFDDALIAYEKAQELAPNHPGAWLCRANLLGIVRRFDEALNCYRTALDLKPNYVDVFDNRANLLVQMKRFEEALSDYDTVHRLRPKSFNLEGERLHAQMHIADWSDFETRALGLEQSIRVGKELSVPFGSLGLLSSPEVQRLHASLWADRLSLASSAPLWNGTRYDHPKIRLAYASADFHEHATSQLMASLFERHDRSKFELFAVSFGPDDRSAMRRRILQSFDRVIDARGRTDEDVAQEIRSAEIDILVDLKGYTQDARAGIFAHRPAPIQVNYLGYPATMSLDAIDYLVADEIVIPKSARAHYSEKIAHLPNSYQANDDKKLIGSRRFGRVDAGLPPNGFVFCCFNNVYKILPDTFDSWIAILKRVPQSVLWLLRPNETAISNLRREAAKRGVEPSRLVFAARAPLADHLARHELADLFLDTLPYNAHTTASDALWAGLPVLTRQGETFAGRVSASLLAALDLNELIVGHRQEYEDLAVQLANDPARLSEIKATLTANRLVRPLFDSALFARDLEDLYDRMYRRYLNDLPPDHLEVGG